MPAYADSWLKVEDGLGGVRPELTGSAESMRAQFAGLMAALEPRYPPASGAVKTDDIKLDNIIGRVYIPVSLNAKRPLPIGVYFPPGGLVIGRSISDEVLCRTLAEKAGTILVCVQYRLSPEYKAPIHLQDSVRAVEWMHKNASTLGGDCMRMYTIGTSAGAGLALAVTRQIFLGLSDAPRDAIKGIVSFCPPTLHPDFIPQIYQETHSSYSEHDENVPIINGSTMRRFHKLSGLDSTNEDYFIALSRQDHARFPPTYIATCELDPLRDDGKVLATSLRDSGVRVKTDHYEGMPHCFWIFPDIPEGADFMENAVTGVRWVIEQC
ncbi:uncharacterized protein AUP68_08738 [Ilyonectria robusta]